MLAAHDPMSYSAFLDAKTQSDDPAGFDPAWMPDFLYDFQAALVEWAVRQGKAALFADCGLGKTPCQLVWAENVHRKTGRPVLLATPLAVSYQTEAEAAKFGVDAATSRDGSVAAPVTITNYERLHHFDPADFAGMVCDESSAIKSFDGERRRIVTAFMRKLPYRLLCTATAAPNDYTELGTSSEALGYLGHMDMLSRFFVNDQNTSKGIRGYNGKQPEWRFKGHAQDAFWRWVASWARAMRRPSDFGFDDGAFILPPLEYRQHIVGARRPPEDRLFDVLASSLDEEREELRRTLPERCEKAAELATEHDVSILWCHLNAEGDLLEHLTPGSLQVKGPDSAEFKEDAARWFRGELCICDRPEFRSKLAAWLKGPRSISGSTTRSTASDESLNQSPTSRSTSSSAASTCAHGHKPTGSTSGPTGQQPPTNATHDAERSTPPTPSCENANGPSPRSTSGRTPKGGSLNDSSGSDSPPTPTGRCSPPRAAGAPSAAALRVETAAGTGSTLITATCREPSEGSSARPAISVSESSEMTQRALNAPGCICGHVSGQRRLISKPVMFGLGLNFQHCAHMVFFPSHSYEQFYQAVRRCWRFGQQHPVTVEIVTTEGGAKALANLQRKAKQADAMFEALVAHMNQALSIRRTEIYDQNVSVPAWL